MKVNLYSGYSILSVALNAGRDTVVRYYATDQNITQIMQTVFPGMNIAYGKNYALNNITLSNAVKIAYTVHDGETPFSAQLETAKAPVTEAIVLQPGGMDHAFGLKGIGLFPILETDIDDIHLAYECSDKILQFWLENEFNAVVMEDEDEVDSGKNRSIRDIHEGIITPLDNYYSIAAREYVKEGNSIKVIDRTKEELEPTELSGGSNLEIHMGYEAYSCDYVPQYDETIAQKALQYYADGVPNEYLWLKATQPLDFLSLWALELGKTYRMKTYCPLGNGTMFGDEMDFIIHYDPKFSSRYLTSVSPTGEEIRLEDHAVPEWVHSYAAVIDEGANELYQKGFPVRNMLDLKRSLQI